MKQDHFIIDHIEDKKDKNALVKLCYFNSEFYTKLTNEQEWIPMKRILVDSDQKQLIYVMEVGDQWEYIRFPLHLWKLIDEAIQLEQDMILVLCKTAEGDVHRSILLQDLHKEARELVQNMRNNANYGEGMSGLIEEHFPLTIQQFV